MRTRVNWLSHFYVFLVRRFYKTCCWPQRRTIWKKSPEYDQPHTFYVRWPGIWQWQYKQWGTLTPQPRMHQIRRTREQSVTELCVHCYRELSATASCLRVGKFPLRPGGLYVRCKSLLLAPSRHRKQVYDMETLPSIRSKDRTLAPLDACSGMTRKHTCRGYEKRLYIVIPV